MSSKKKFIKSVPVLLSCMLLLTACGSNAGVSSTFDEAQNYGGNFSISNSNSAGFDGFSGMKSDSAYDVADDYVEQDYSYEEYASDGGNFEEIEEIPKVTNTVEEEVVLKQDMLVYTCNMQVDVLDFDEATKQLRDKINQYQGFIEQESLTDGNSTNNRYTVDEDKWHTYRAVIRIPSKDYETFCNDVSALGDLRVKEAQVENVSQEYNDLSVTLHIYEQKEERYMQMLAVAEDDSTILDIEKMLTTVQVDIAQLKTRMQQIKTDVAYSYINLSMREVKEYVEVERQQEEEKTFGMRLKEVVEDATEEFLEFLEEFLYFLIYVVPYCLLFGGLILLGIKIIKAIWRSHKKRKQKKEEQKALKNWKADKKQEVTSEEKVAEDENKE